jgi:hypothetical protein
MQYPPLVKIRQMFKTSPIQDIPGRIHQELAAMNLRKKIRPGDSVAVAAGSRGISNLDSILAALIKELKALEARPFLVPAMGSHGGATGKGQKAVLSHYGITLRRVGAPIRSAMAVVQVGITPDGIPVFVDRHAAGADHIVVVNRIKPHTEFKAAIESGLMKMLAIGLGKQKGAETCHHAVIEHGYLKVIVSVANEVLKQCPVLFGLALVENQRDETEIIRAVSARGIERAEKGFLRQAKKLMPRIPFDDIHLLIVDQMGKDVSGVGMDPNVIARSANILSDHYFRRTKPKALRILVRDLTPESAGNAIGIGNADFTTKRLVNKIDHPTTLMNCLTASDPGAGKMPLAFTNDQDAIGAALKTIGNVEPRSARIVHIRDTRWLEDMEISEAMIPEAESMGNLRLMGPSQPLLFDRRGNLLSVLQS